MTEIAKELEKYGLDEGQYELCLLDIQNKINGINDMDWRDIVEKYNLGIHSDTLRKASNTIFGGAFVREYYDVKEMKNNDSRAYLAQLKVEKENISKERQKFRDEKLEYNKWLREQARDELICEKICEAIKSLKPLEIYPIHECKPTRKEYVLCFADTHYGTEFAIKGLYGETISEYSPEIFEERMSVLLADVLGVIRENGIDNIRVFSLGDELDGILRASQLMKLRYGVVESTVRYAEYICAWLTELTKYVRVDFYATKGNHTELRLINQPKGTFEKENMSYIINEIIKIRLKDNPNFKFHVNETGLIFTNICGYNVLGIHGEVKNLENALHRFTVTYKTMIDILVGGHKHHMYGETIGRQTEVLGVPSIIGIDDFSMTLTKTADPGAVMYTMERGKGIVEQRNFKL